MILRNPVHAITAAVLLMASASLSRAHAADQVAVQLDYVVRGDHAMFFVGQDKGFFAQNGIEVTAIRKGSGSSNGLRLVSNGNAEFGFADLPTLLVARSQKIPAVALIPVNQDTPLAIISVKARHPLTKPADLKGLNIGIDPAGSTYIFLKEFFAVTGLSLQDVKQSTVTPPYENYLVLGRVDVVPGYIDAEVPEIEAKTGGPGTLSILQGTDFGIHVYGTGVFTSENMIATKPDLVGRFVKAYEQAFAYTLDHPDEAVAIVVKANPEYKGKEEVLSAELKADLDHTFLSAETKANGLGWNSPAEWTATAKAFQDQGGLPKDLDVVAAYDNRFVAAAAPVKR
jgi:NitT/TauT family transport system substrate-binding protein